MTNDDEQNENPLIEAAVAASGDQQELRELYLEQQHRLCCPGCAEEPFID